MTLTFPSLSFPPSPPPSLPSLLCPPSLPPPPKKKSSSHTEDQIAIKTAEKLLLEVRPQTAAAELKVRVLECYILLHSRQKSSIEKALEKLMVMASTNVSCAGHIEVCLVCALPSTYSLSH